MRFQKTIFTIILLSVAICLSSQTASFMTLNIRYDNPKDKPNSWPERKAEMVLLLNHYEPDIFGIQEGLEHQVKYLDSCLLEYAYIGVGRDDGKKAGEYSAIFYDSTSFKVVENSTFWLSETPEEISVGWDASMERICTYGLFQHKKSGQQCWVFNTHFDHMGEVARANSAILINRKIRQLNQEQLPVIVMGDFNAVPESRPIQALTNALDDAQTIAEHPFYGPVGTFNGFSDQIIDRRIDYIFTNKLKVLSYVHIDDRRTNNLFISDHIPVMAEVVFSKED